MFVTVSAKFQGFVLKFTFSEDCCFVENIPKACVPQPIAQPGKRVTMRSGRGDEERVTLVELPWCWSAYGRDMHPRATVAYKTAV